jgi:hypothetical protein
VRGQGVVTLIYPEDSAPEAFSGDPIILSKSGADIQNLTVNGGYDMYRWRVDGTIKEYGNSIFLYAADYTVGTHQISLEVTRGGAEYSKFGSFRVED